MRDDLNRMWEMLEEFKQAEPDTIFYLKLLHYETGVLEIKGYAYVVKAVAKSFIQLGDLDALAQIDLYRMDIQEQAEEDE